MPRLITALLSLVLCYGASAESVTWRDYRIHYTTFPSVLIPAKVASAHNLVRAENRIVTNIVIIRGDLSEKATIEGTARNLLGQLLKLEFKEVSEQESVYYLASLVVQESDTLFYSLTIQPEDSESPYMLEFTREYLQ